MSKEKGTTAQKGTGADYPVIQKLHRTGERNVKFKLNRKAARMLFKGNPKILTMLQTKMSNKGVFNK